MMMMTMLVACFVTCCTAPTRTPAQAPAQAPAPALLLRIAPTTQIVSCYNKKPENGMHEQIREHANTRTRKHANTQTRERANTQTHVCAVYIYIYTAHTCVFSIVCSSFCHHRHTNNACTTHGDYILVPVLMPVLVVVRVFVVVRVLVVVRVFVVVFIAARQQPRLAASRPRASKFRPRP